MERNQPFDFLQRLIQPGDICAYPVRRGSKMWLNRLTVQEIVYDPKGNPQVKGRKEDGYPVTISALDRLVLVGRGNVPFMGDGDEN